MSPIELHRLGCQMQIFLKCLKTHKFESSEAPLQGVHFLKLHSLWKHYCVQCTLLTVDCLRSILVGLTRKNPNPNFIKSLNWHVVWCSYQTNQSIFIEIIDQNIFFESTARQQKGLIVKSPVQTKVTSAAMHCIFAKTRVPAASFCFEFDEKWCALRRL